MVTVNKNTTAYRINHFIPRERLPEISGIVQEIIDNLPGLTAKQLYSRMVQMIHANVYRAKVHVILD